MNYYYSVSAIRKDNRIEETVRTFDSSMGLTDAEARIAALEYELLLRKDKRYSATRVTRRPMAIGMCKP